MFIVDGTTYLHTRDGGLHLVATTRENVSPSLVLELLKRVGSIIRVRLLAHNQRALLAVVPTPIARTTVAC